jgi:hypothetical protein
MSKYITKYFQFIGVENEGLKRILILVLISWYGVVLMAGGAEFLQRGLSFEIDDILETLILIVIFFIFIPLVFSIVVKILMWIIDGFKQGKSSNE